MKTTDSGVSGIEGQGPLPPSAPQRPLHRLAAARRQRHVSRQHLADGLHVDLETLRELEQAQSDFPLSLLYRCQEVLNVPLHELLVDAPDSSALPPAARAKMADWLRTVAMILKQAKQPAVCRLAHNLVNQMVELMPELKDLAAQYEAGNEQLLDSHGRAVRRPSH